ncbi:MAG TPA: rhodanese-like domain-containing protein [Candidatus Marinimicrobia bacterium]|nr:rhodanese-like domain-containing protein [Candidatus Neomarinimicrobiota bacterium]HRS51294.1 rhodanese-like domain-containing protein [Candidatus Neomarinimicrobiota bacterium]HRU91468.1 rhodanese-like domain-containing protein [Candidatus Neomarinimicrobiota bacterium]
MKKIVKTILLRSIWLGLGVIVIGLIFNWLSPNGIPLVAKYQTVIVQGESQKIPLFMKRKAQSNKETDLGISPVSELNTEKARQFFTTGGTIFIDTREYEDYLAGHIAGAISIPFSEFQNDPTIVEELDRGLRIVTYCDGGECQSSIDMAVRLNEMGFEQVWFYFGGWNEWVEADLPIVKGSKP